jgi:hypothetical protein
MSSPVSPPDSARKSLGEVIHVSPLPEVDGNSENDTVVSATVDYKHVRLTLPGCSGEIIPGQSSDRAQSPSSSEDSPSAIQDHDAMEVDSLSISDSGEPMSDGPLSQPRLTEDEFDAEVSVI